VISAPVSLDPAPVLLAFRAVKHYYTGMVKVISKIGNSQGLIMDQALLELAHLKVGDQVNIEVHDGGTLTLTPCKTPISAEMAKESARRIIGKNSEIFRRLS
jgi:antitoxin component of MazEF toxin-antitoxin module